MSEIVERVAKAIDALRNGSREGRARAAIAAMREPTQAMEDAGISAPEAIRPSCDHEVIVNPRRIWQAMNDEALK